MFGPEYNRVLVCEGQCNPDLRDYDIAMRRSMNGGKEEDDPAMINGAVRDFMLGWVKNLRHTVHVKVAHHNFHNGSWVCKYKCGECGHMRWF